MLTPWHILATVSLLLILMYVVDRGVTRRRSRHLRHVAAELHMRYCPIDRFRIAPRLALTLPIGAAADVRVRDLMYGHGDRDGGGGAYVYVFTIEYAVGTMSGLSRQHVVGRVVEPAERSCEQFGQVILADQTKPVDDQYRALLAAPEPATPSPGARMLAS